MVKHFRSSFPRALSLLRIHCIYFEYPGVTVRAGSYGRSASTRTRSYRKFVNPPCFVEFTFIWYASSCSWRECAKCSPRHILVFFAPLFGARYGATWTSVTSHPGRVLWGSSSRKSMNMSFVGGPHSPGSPKRIVFRSLVFGGIASDFLYTFAFPPVATTPGEPSFAFLVFI